jgi:hypothetical protein
MSSSPIPHSSVVIHTTIYQCVKVLCLHHRFRSWHIQTQTKCCGCWCHWIKQCVLDDLQHKHMTICVSGTSSACSCCIMPKLLWWERSHPRQRWKFLFQTCFSNFLLVVDWSIRMQHLKNKPHKCIQCYDEVIFTCDIRPCNCSTVILELSREILASCDSSCSKPPNHM